MAAARFYSSTSGLMELQSDITSLSTTMSVDSTTGLPGSTPFTLVIEPGVTGSEEIVTVTNVGGTTLTITRGVDGTTATSHSAGSEIRHMATARDFREPQEHMGESENVHGVGSGSDVVGTDTVQTLKNKTAAAASASTAGLVVKGAASQTASILDVQTSAGTSVVAVKPGEGSLTVGTTVQANYGPAATLFGYVARLIVNAAANVGLIIKAAASQTADLLQIQNSSGTTLAKFDKDGKLTAPAVTTSGNVTVGDDLAVTGDITAATLTTTGAATADSVTTTADVTVGGDVDVTGSVTADNVDANMPFASSSKAGKRTHWGVVTSGTTDSNGYATITHGAGFTPTVVVASNENGYQMGVDSVGATTFRIRILQANGAVFVGATTKVSYFCGE